MAENLLPEEAIKNVAVICRIFADAEGNALNNNHYYYYQFAKPCKPKGGDKEKEHKDRQKRDNRKRCYTCNETGHFQHDCPKKRRQDTIGESTKKIVTCTFCSKRSHDASKCWIKQRTQGNNQGRKKPEANVCHVSSPSLTPILLKTTLVYCLIDSGADCSLIKKSVAKKVGCNIVPFITTLYGLGEVNLSTIGRLTTVMQSEDVSLEIDLYVIRDCDSSHDVIIGRNVLSHADLRMVTDIGGTRLLRDPGAVNSNQLGQQCCVITTITDEARGPVEEILQRKKNGSDRLCVDYRALNRITIKDRYPLPLIDDQLGKGRYFTTLDMTSGFHQIPIAAESIEKTTFVTSDGHYKYLRMPFGLNNAPAVFQRAIHRALGNLRNKVALAYIDDVLIRSSTVEGGLDRLDQVLKALSIVGFSLNLPKCKFLQEKVEYLGRQAVKYVEHADFLSRNLKPDYRINVICEGSWLEIVQKKDVETKEIVRRVLVKESIASDFEEITERYEILGKNGKPQVAPKDRLRPWKGEWAGDGEEDAIEECPDEPC
ncbi:uncharacterized protein LOC123987675 [Osmia bicornis bicornis]|uniref:uncharacterized protein LOC123987675 n=1 Tax=Osmia bicornis bicornis TaxID=1437191 RepID=UPI001EAF2AA4|nr:uncharacterized protein LOC123987675 [Osmia bicornis bicornis]